MVIQTKMQQEQEIHLNVWIFQLDGAFGKGKPPFFDHLHSSKLTRIEDVFSMENSDMSISMLVYQRAFFLLS